MFIVKWWNELSGEVTIWGSKNAVLPILAASLLVKWKTILTNVPVIGDVHTFLEILESLWVHTELSGTTLTLDTSHIEKKDFDDAKMKKIRASVLLLAPLLHHFWEVDIPSPGGCNLGKRPVDAHLNALQDIGYKVQQDEEGNIKIHGKSQSGDRTLNAAFGVTPTENILVANVLRKGVTTIKNAALEPHVMNLVDFLRTAGADISIRYDHTIIVEGVEELKELPPFAIVSDYIQSGTYMVIAALCAKDYIDIHHARIKDLYSYIEKFREAGVKVEEREDDTLRVYRAHTIVPHSIQTNIFPGFPTDLQSPFVVMMTQAEGTSYIHEVLFESRLGWLVELEKLGANIGILNPHEAEIEGKTELKGAQVTSWDLRAGAAMVIAGLIARGETHITNIDYIKRGYEDFVANLKNLGADIEDISEGK